MTDPADHRWAFVLGHPGHELRAFHLAEVTRPIVSILTDGSGTTGESRLMETTALLASLGAVPGPVYGAMTDRVAYAHLMRGEASPFIDLGDALAGHFVEDGITAVLVDAAEGYNPVHDVCHWLGRAAAARASRRGHEIRVFEVDLVGRPDGAGSGVRMTLDAAAFARKLAAVEQHVALADEAAAAFARHGADAFREEFFRDAVDAAIPPADWVPHYEQVGEDRVRQGRYRSALRYATHVRPVVAALHEAAIGV